MENYGVIIDTRSAESGMAHLHLCEIEENKVYSISLQLTDEDLNTCGGDHDPQDDLWNTIDYKDCDREQAEKWFMDMCVKFDLWYKD